MKNTFSVCSSFMQNVYPWTGEKLEPNQSWTGGWGWKKRKETNHKKFELFFRHCFYIISVADPKVVQFPPDPEIAQLLHNWEWPPAEENLNPFIFIKIEIKRQKNWTLHNLQDVESDGLNNQQQADTQFEMTQRWAYKIKIKILTFILPAPFLHFQFG